MKSFILVSRAQRLVRRFKEEYQGDAEISYKETPFDIFIVVGDAKTSILDCTDEEVQEKVCTMIMEQNIDKIMG